MWKSSFFILVSAFLLNDHLSSGNLMSCVKVIEQLPVEILEIPINILYDIKDLFLYTYCHLGYLTEFMEYVTGCNYCDGYENPSCPVHIEKPMDCYEILKNCQTESGVYTIWPKSDDIVNKSIDVYCDMDTDGGGWTVLLRRDKYPTQENFNRSWSDYKLGFGDLKKDFWIGNDKIYAISNQAQYEVRFDLEDANGEKGYAVYTTFSIENEACDYKLHIENYTGNVQVSEEDEGISMGYHNNMKFSTYDKDNDNCSNPYLISCAIFLGGGWWYDNCSGSYLTSLYKPGTLENAAIHWFSWRKEGLAAVDMKLRPRRN